MRCPSCRQELAALARVRFGAGMRSPDGAPAVCARCGAVGRIVDLGPLGLTVREATVDELKTWADDPRFVQLMQHITATRARLGLI